MARNYFSIKQMENGWLVSANEYANDSRMSGQWVAYTHEEVLKIVGSLLENKKPISPLETKQTPFLL